MIAMFKLFYNTIAACQRPVGPYCCQINVCMYVCMSRNGENFEIFSNFLAYPVESPWPTLTVLYQNVSRSLPYILNHIF